MEIRKVARLLHTAAELLEKKGFPDQPFIIERTEASHDLHLFLVIWRASGPEMSMKKLVISDEDDIERLRDLI